MNVELRLNEREQFLVQIALQVLFVRRSSPWRSGNHRIVKLRHERALIPGLFRKACACWTTISLASVASSFVATAAIFAGPENI